MRYDQRPCFQGDGGSTCGQLALDKEHVGSRFGILRYSGKCMELLVGDCLGLFRPQCNERVASREMTT